MSKFILLFLIASFPTLLTAQNSFWSNDSVSNNIRKNDCHGIVFTRVEQIPSLKISNKAFEDTLATILKMENGFFETDGVIFKFIITTKSQMFDLAKESGEIANENIVIESLLSLSNLWLPAKQNGRGACSWVRLEMKIIGDKLKIKIGQ